MSRFLVCAPDYFSIDYEINPWMNRSLGAVRELAFRQWKDLHDALVSLGVKVETMTPRPGLPDLVFTANAGLVFHSTFLSSRFRHEVRAKESPYFDMSAPAAAPTSPQLTTALAPARIPEGIAVDDWTRDGKYLVVRTFGRALFRVPEDLHHVRGRRPARDLLGLDVPELRELADVRLVLPIADAGEVAVGSRLASVLRGRLAVHLEGGAAGLPDHPAQEVNVVHLDRRGRRLRPLDSQPSL